MAFNFTNLTGEFYLVGLGASAGGLDALEDFFTNLPEVLGVSFIIIQHLSYDFHSLMAEILSNKTKLPIEVIADSCLIKPNKIYLIPPDYDLHIKTRKFYLKHKNKSHLEDLTIDKVFRSIANEKRSYGVGIVLSGAGFDGKEGCVAIKDAGGAVFAQDPFTAKFSSMPLAAIETGCVEYVAKAELLASSLLKYLSVQSAGSSEFGIPEPELNAILQIIRKKTGEDFNYYKAGALQRRILRRIKINDFDYVSEYIGFLRNSPGEAEVLKNDLLIGYTKFFRDSPVFESFDKNVIPLLFGPDCSSEKIILWDIGCSTGEETYSLACLIYDYIENTGCNKDFRIIATDLDEKALSFADKGIYSQNVINDIPERFINKYFEKTPRGVKVTNKLKEKIVFLRHNVIDDPAISNNDVIVCRNLLIYFKSEIQKQVLLKMTVALKERGFLFLGDSETIGDLREYYLTIDALNKIYRLTPNISLKRNYDFDLRNKLFNNSDSNITEYLRLSDAEVLNEMPVCAVLLDEEYRLIKPYGDLSQYLESNKFEPGEYIIKNFKPDFAIFFISTLHKIKMKKVNAPVITKIGAPNVVLKINALELDNQSDKYYLCKFFNSLTQESDDNFSEPALAPEILRERNRKLSAENSAMKSVLQDAFSEIDKLIVQNSELDGTINAIDDFLNISGIGLLFIDADNIVRRVNSIALNFIKGANSVIGDNISLVEFIFDYPGIADDINYAIENKTCYISLVEHNTVKYVIKISPSDTSSKAKAVLGIFSINE